MDRRYRASILALGLAAALLAGLLWMLRDDLALLGELEVLWPWMIGAILLTVVGTLLSFLRWYFLVKAQELPFTMFDALRLGLIGTFFNFLIPGAVGGDLVKAALIAREQSKRLIAVSTIVVDRIVGLLGLLVLTGLIAIFWWGSIGKASLWSHWPAGISGFWVSLWRLWLFFSSGVGHSRTWHLELGGFRSSAPHWLLWSTQLLRFSRPRVPSLPHCC